MNDGGPAFPFLTETEINPGMSLRDYFAAMALQGLCAFAGGSSIATNIQLASASYAMADAMLKERVK